ncbi:MAG: Gfo/Idh/MocA family oxidoreductase [Candidatus Omnitrophica bacterium]|nr:Gfo/Idh/MocA family oxidoreductase [Candidatus Omnitrophota bacterium]
MAAESSEDRHSDMRFFVIGCGSIGKRHIRNLLSLEAGAVLAYDPLESCRREIREMPQVETVDSIDDAWAWKPDSVLVCSPNIYHIEHALRAAEHDCRLFIEKPLSHQMEGVDRLIRLIREKKLASLVGCNMRFHPGLKKVKELLEKGAIGAIVSARAEFGQYLPDWRPNSDYRRSYSARRDLGGGIVLDAIHEIDYIRWLAGGVKTVSCMMDKVSRLEMDVEDAASMVLRFENGAIGEVHVDCIQRAYKRACRIIGEEGSIEWDYSKGEVLWYSAENREWKRFINPDGWQVNDMYLDELRHFLQCLSDPAVQPVQDAAEGARALEIALAAKQSSLQSLHIHLERHD